ISLRAAANPRRLGGTSTPGDAWGIAAAGDYVFVTEFSTTGLFVFDASDPTLPHRVAHIGTSGPTGYHLAVSGNYLYVSRGDARLEILDISNPLLPKTVRQHDTSGVALGVTVSGHYAYLADYKSGVQVIDIDRPDMSQQISTIDTPGNATGIAVS